MALENNQLQFLWHLFQLYFIKGLEKDALQWVATMYERALDFPEKFESLLLSYWKSNNDFALTEAAVTAAKQFCFDPEKHVILVAILVERGAININDAASLLFFSGVNPDGFHKSVRHVIDVAWLVNQDSKDGVMSPQQDSLLKNALRDVLDQFDKNKN